MEADPVKDLQTIALIIWLLSEAIKPFLRTQVGLVPRHWAAIVRVALAVFLVWLHMGHPVPQILQAREDMRLDHVHWQLDSGTQIPYKWWQFGQFGVDTVMPVPACTHYARAKTLQDAVVILPPEPTQRELMELSPQAAKERTLRYGSVLNSSLDGRDQCFMTVRDEHLHLTTTMPYLTTDTMAPSLTDFVAQSPHRDLLSAPSDGRVDDILVSRLGETFARVVAIVKQAPTSKHEAYSLALKQVLLPLTAFMQTIQQWYDDQLRGAVVKVHIDPCHCPALDGILRSGMYAHYDRATGRFSLLARMDITDPNTGYKDLMFVDKMPFAAYLNPHPALVHEHLPTSLQASFSYSAKFRIGYYNLSAVLTNYGLLAQRVNQIIPYWLPLAPDTTQSVDHIPLAIAPLDKLVGKGDAWIEQDEVTACIVYCDRLEEAILRAATGEHV